MQISSPPIASPAPPPAAPASPAPPGDASAFAKLLSANQAAAQNDTAPPPDPHGDGAAHDAAAAAADTAAQPLQSAGCRPAPPPARASAGKHAAPTADPAEAKTQDARDADPAAKTARDANGDAPSTDTPLAAPDAALAAWWAALLPPAATAAPAGVAGGAAAHAAKIAADASASGSAAGLTMDGKVHADAARPDQRADLKAIDAAMAAGMDDGTDTVKAAALVAAEPSDGPIHRVDRTAAADAAPAAPAGLGAAPPAPAVDTPLSVTLPTPVDAPEFRGALAVQVSLLARDGVQHAQLHLNPADMGPISVQIALDGAQARVDFGADSAATRHLIETGLPELAAALREAGLTLSGGGVSQHAGGRSDGDAATGTDGGARRVSASSAGSVRNVTLRLPQGNVDLYA